MGSWDETRAATGRLRELLASTEEQARARIAEADVKSADALRHALAEAQRRREGRQIALRGLRAEIAGKADTAVNSLGRMATLIRPRAGDPVERGN